MIKRSFGSTGLMVSALTLNAIISDAGSNVIQSVSGMAGTNVPEDVCPKQLCCAVLC
jgi:hypothetical protein